MKCIFTALITLMFVINLNAQNLSIYGVTLGSSKSTVIRNLEAKGEKVTLGQTKEGVQYVSVAYLEVGDINWEKGNFYFENDKLNRVCVLCADGGLAGDPNGPWYPAFLQKSKKYKNYFVRMLQNLSLKYGEPTSASDYYVVWQNAKQKITLEYEYRLEPSHAGYGTLDSSTGVWLTYELVDLNKVNY